MLRLKESEKMSLRGLERFTGRVVAKRNRRWPSVLPETVVGDYLVVPLTSSKMLKSEGYRMNNCSREYSGLCGLGSYLIFSIRSRSGERVATLGMRKRDEFWRFEQCLGPGNSNVMDEEITYCDENGTVQQEWYPTELYYVAHEVVRLVNSRYSGAGADH